MFVTEIIRDRAELQKCEEDWRLLSQNSDSTFYDSYDYFSYWWDTLSTEKEQLFLICVYDEHHKLMALAPFIKSTHNSWKEMKRRIVHIGFARSGDFHNILIDKRVEDKGKILRYIFELLRKETFHILYLDRINPSSWMGYYILSQEDLKRNFRQRYMCPYINIADFGSYEQYLRTIPLSKTMKYNIRTLKNRFGCVLKVFGGAEIYPIMCRIHDMELNFLKKRKGEERQSPFHGKNAVFLEKLYENSESTMGFVLYTREGDIVSYNTCFLFNHRFHSWNIGYNPDYAAYSPSKVLYYYILEYLFETEQYQEVQFDFGSGSYVWKHSFTEKEVINFSLYMKNPKNRGLEKVFADLKYYKYKWKLIKELIN